MTIAKFLAQNRAGYADGNAALFYERGEAGLTAVSYDEFCERAYRIAAGLYARFGAGKHIGLVAEGSWQYFLQLCAVILSGNVAVSINQTNPTEKIAELIRLGDVSVLLCDEEWQEDLAQVCPETALLTMTEAEKLTGAEKPDSGKQEDTAVILFSSGTTGAAKAVSIRQESLTVYGLELKRQDDFTRRKGGNPVILFLPYYHIGGISMTLEAIAMGESVFVGSLKYMLKDMADFAFSRMAASPAMAERVLAAADKNARVAEHIKELREILCVGAPYKEETLRRMEQYGVTPRMYYGLTETAGVVSGMGEYKRGACGKIPAYTSVRIQNGEIQVKGVQVFAGYYHNPEADRLCFDDGWFCTGDLGEIDGEGYLFIRGRIKNTIILSNGENVCPEELEELLYRCALVQECMVYGADEEIRADVWLGEAPAPQAQEAVMEHLKSVNRGLPLAHRIKSLRFTEKELPKNATGKVMRG